MNHDQKGEMLPVDRALSEVHASEYDALLLPVFEQFEISFAQAQQSAVGAAIDDADVECYQL